MTGLFFAVVHVVGDDRARLSPRGEVEVWSQREALYARPTAKQLVVLRLIADGIRGGLPPTVRELAKLTGKTQHSAYLHVQSLERRGLVRVAPGRARAITVTAAGWKAVA